MSETTPRVSPELAAEADKHEAWKELDAIRECGQGTKVPLQWEALQQRLQDARRALREANERADRLEADCARLRRECYAHERAGDAVADHSDTLRAEFDALVVAVRVVVEGSLYTPIGYEADVIRGDAVVGRICQECGSREDKPHAAGCAMGAALNVLVAAAGGLRPEAPK